MSERSSQAVSVKWSAKKNGACRGIVKQIDMWGIDMVFVVGGNGGNAGANAIQAECEEQGVVCSVVGIPKSIDNDILLVGLCAAGGRCTTFRFPGTCCAPAAASPSPLMTTSC